MTTSEKPTAKKNLSRADTFGRQMKHQTYELLLETHEKLRDTSKEFKLTAGEVLEVIFSNVDMGSLAPHFAELRVRKEEVREKAKEAKRVEKPKPTVLAKQLKDLPPEKLAEIQAIINATK